MSVRQFATIVGVSAATISQVERGITDPSLGTLRGIAKALQVPLFDLFADEDQPSATVIRADEGTIVQTGGRDIGNYRRVSPIPFPLEVLDGRLEPGAASSDDLWSHPADECALVIEGQLTVHVGDEVHELDVNDSCAFDSNVPHRYVNNGTVPARFVVAVTPPSY